MKKTMQKVSFYLSKDSYIKLNLHALMRHTTASEIVEEMVAKLNEFTVVRNSGPEPEAEPPGNVYFVRDTGTGLVKIGYSTNPHGRIASLQTGASSPLEILGTVHGDQSREKSLHRKFKKLNVSGEWHRDDGTIAKYLAENAE